MVVKRRCSPSQRKLIEESTGAEDGLARLTRLEARQAHRLSLRCVQKVGPFLDALQLYDGAMKTYCNRGMGELALLWGSVSLIIEVSNIAAGSSTN